MTTTTPETIALPVEAGAAIPAALRFARGLRDRARRRARPRRRRDVRLRPAVRRPGPARRVRSARSTCPGCRPGGRRRRARGRRTPACPRASSCWPGRTGRSSIPYAELGRRADVDAMVAEAMAVGRAGNPVERVIADARTALRGVTLTPAGHLRRRGTADRITALAHAPRSSPDRRRRSCPSTTDRKFMVVPGQRRSRRRSRPRPSPRPSPRSARSTRRPSLGVDLVDHARRAGDHDRRGVQRQGPGRPADRAGSPWPSRTSRSPSTSSTVAAAELDDLRADRRRRLRADASTRATLDARPWSASPRRSTSDPVNASFKTSGGRITGVTPSRNGYKLDVGRHPGGRARRRSTRAGPAPSSPRSSRPSRSPSRS